MKLPGKNNILTLFIILSVIFLKMEIHPANRQIQEQKLQHEAIAENYGRTLRELQQFRYVDLNVMERFAGFIHHKALDK
jgi:hypothetical protein